MNIIYEFILVKKKNYLNEWQLLVNIISYQLIIVTVS
jgi:hypothetical protein